jgi:hypothetical protein
MGGICSAFGEEEKYLQNPSIGSNIIEGGDRHPGIFTRQHHKPIFELFFVK